MEFNSILLRSNSLDDTGWSLSNAGFIDFKHLVISFDYPKTQMTHLLVTTNTQALSLHRKS